MNSKRPSTGMLANAGLERRVPLRGRITAQVSSCSIARLLVLATEERRRPVVIYIDSLGGSLTHALSLLSTMNGIKCPVATFSRARVGGVAAVIAAHGTPGARTAEASCRFSLRLPDATSGSAARVENEEALVPVIAEILARDVKRPLSEVLKWITSGAEFTAQEALSYGFIDHIAKEPVMPKPI